MSINGFKGKPPASSGGASNAPTRDAQQASRGNFQNRGTNQARQGDTEQFLSSGASNRPSYGDIETRPPMPLPKQARARAPQKEQHHPPTLEAHVRTPEEEQLDAHQQPPPPPLHARRQPPPPPPPPLSEDSSDEEVEVRSKTASPNYSYSSDEEVRKKPMPPEGNLQAGAEIPEEEQLYDPNWQGHAEIPEEEQLYDPNWQGHAEIPEQEQLYDPDWQGRAQTPPGPPPPPLPPKGGSDEETELYATVREEYSPSKKPIPGEYAEVSKAGDGNLYESVPTGASNIRKPRLEAQAIDLIAQADQLRAEATDYVTELETDLAGIMGLAFDIEKEQEPTLAANPKKVEKEKKTKKAKKGKKAQAQAEQAEQPEQPGQLQKRSPSKLAALKENLTQRHPVCIASFQNRVNHLNQRLREIGDRVINARKMRGGPVDTQLHEQTLHIRALQNKFASVETRLNEYLQQIEDTGFLDNLEASATPPPLTVEHMLTINAMIQESKIDDKDFATFIDQMNKTVTTLETGARSAVKSGATTPAKYAELVGANLSKHTLQLQKLKKQLTVNKNLLISVNQELRNPPQPLSHTEATYVRELHNQNADLSDTYLAHVQSLIDRLDKIANMS